MTENNVLRPFLASYLTLGPFQTMFNKCSEHEFVIGLDSDQINYHLIRFYLTRIIIKTNWLMFGSFTQSINHPVRSFEQQSVSMYAISIIDIISTYINLYYKKITDSLSVSHCLRTYLMYMSISALCVSDIHAFCFN